MARLEQRGEYTLFNFNGVTYQVEKSAGNIAVAQGVVCDTYTIKGCESQFDLGIIRVGSGCKTPRQRVLRGDKTVEGILDGIGTFEVLRQKSSGADISPAPEKYHVDVGADPDFMQVVRTGDVMQWSADPGVPLTFYELCWPPYEDGRFENL